MKNMKSLNRAIILSSIFLIATVNAEVKNFVENAYLAQASKEIIAKTNTIAQLMEFDGPYEVVVPKKAGIQINPWNKFVSQGINPQTKNNLIIINPEWFFNIPEGQQDFLLGRAFMRFKHGDSSLSMKISPFLFVFLSWFFIFLLFWGLGKTRLGKYKKWMHFIAAIIIVNIANRVLFAQLHEKIFQHLRLKRTITMSNMVIKKTQDKNSAIKALESLDSAIKNELKAGETFFAPYESTFKNQVNELSK